MRAQQSTFGSTAKGLTFEGVLCWLPLATYLCLFAFTAIALFEVGHWPSYGRPDPSTLQLPLLYGAALLSYPIAMIALGWG
jgi:hypothetical protein